MTPQRQPGELVWIHNNMVRCTPGAPNLDRYLIIPSDRSPRPYARSTVMRLRSWAMVNPAPDPEQCFCITPCFSGHANARLCPKQMECPPDCHSQGTILHDILILLSGKTKEDALESIINANHPRQLAHMVPENSMFDCPQPVQSDEHSRHIFRQVFPHQDVHCVCCHISHSTMWMRCDCGAHACSSCAIDGAESSLHGVRFN